MMIKCAKCGYENQLGSIFCRGCGEKIDTSALDPQGSSGEGKGKVIKTKKKSKISLGTLITLLILAGLGALVYMMLNSSGIPKYKELEKNYAKSVRNLERNRDAVFTTAQMTSWYNHEILAKNIADTDGAVFALKNIRFTENKTDEALMTVYIGTELFSYPVIFTLTGSLSKGEENKPVIFTAKTLKIGKVNIPAAAMPYVLDKFAPLTKVAPLKEAFERAASVRYDDGKLNFSFKAD